MKLTVWELIEIITEKSWGDMGLPIKILNCKSNTIIISTIYTAIQKNELVIFTRKINKMCNKPL